jgi:hypothetical protein
MSTDSVKNPAFVAARRAAYSGKHAGRSASNATAGPSLHIIFHQLSQALNVLSSAAELVLEGKSGGPAAQPLRVWLQPNARQAEAALHRLREFRLLHIPATTDLIQSLTVLVLAADMLIQGQLSQTSSRDTYDLLLRNADRAMASLQLLREHIAHHGHSL